MIRKQHLQIPTRPTTSATCI